MVSKNSLHNRKTKNQNFRYGFANNMNKVYSQAIALKCNEKLKGDLDFTASVRWLSW